MSNKELELRLALIRELENQKKELDDQIEVLKDNVKAELDAQGVSSLRAGSYEVSWKSYKFSRFDTSAFKSAHADLYDEFSKTVEAKRFVIR